MGTAKRRVQRRPALLRVPLPIWQVTFLDYPSLRRCAEYLRYHGFILSYHVVAGDVPNKYLMFVAGTEADLCPYLDRYGHTQIILWRDYVIQH